MSQDKGIIILYVHNQDLFSIITSSLLSQCALILFLDTILSTPPNIIIIVCAHITSQINQITV